MRVPLPLMAVALVLVGCRRPSSAPAAAGGPDRLVADAVARAEHEEPERALRAFFRAFLDQDEAALRGLTVDCPDRAELWSFGGPITHPDRRREFLEPRMRRVTLGETVYLPVPPTPNDLRPVVTDDAMINDGRAVILTDDYRLLPWLLVRSGGVWRVDPYTFVAAIRSGREYEEQERREREREQRRVQPAGRDSFGI